MTIPDGTIEIRYNDTLARRFAVASLCWGLLVMLAGIWLGIELVWWRGNIAPWFSFGRLRAAHTQLLPFGFVANLVFAGVYYSSQRVLRVRALDWVGSVHFWGWQVSLVAALIACLAGYSQTAWVLYVGIALFWTLYLVNLFSMVVRRREARLYVSVWFALASGIAFGLAHLINVPLWDGVGGAWVQAWYSQNVSVLVGIMPIVGMMYYFVPKFAHQPLYSYRLSVVHFWMLLVCQVAAAPVGLAHSPVPDWLQSVGMLGGILLAVASWGGVLNGFLTLRPVWDRVRTEPPLRFFALALLSYGLYAIHGALLSVKSVASLAQFTDWAEAQSQLGTLGWVGLFAAGLFYGLRPSAQRGADTHFRLASLGLAFLILAQVIGGITQGVMWRAESLEGGLRYPGFVETVVAIRWMQWIALLGMSIYFLGFAVIAWNVFRCQRSGERDDKLALATPSLSLPLKGGGWGGGVFAVGTAALLAMVLWGNSISSAVGVLLLVLWAMVFALVIAMTPSDRGLNRWLEQRPWAMTALIVVIVGVGAAVELTPAFRQPVSSQHQGALEQTGREIYLQEGCPSCHSQLVRPFLWEVARYGEVSQSEPSIWGTRRIGPDLARVGGKYPDAWHVEHLADPRAVSSDSNMPSYRHLAENERVALIAYLQRLGVTAP